MNEKESTMCICGHDKWSHAISLKGEVGMCMKEIIKGWEWCSCEEFTPKTENKKSKTSFKTLAQNKQSGV